MNGPADLPSTTKSTPTLARGSGTSSAPNICAAESSRETYATSLPGTLPADASMPSPVSGRGSMPLGSRAGQTTFPLGPEVAPASRSASPGADAEQPTSGTSGRSGSGSSASAALQSSLESRLRDRLASRGSTLFALTWKEAVTPSGRRFCLLRASGLRTSGTEFTSWPTPNATGADRGGQAERTGGRRSNLIDVAQLAPWPTATVKDAASSGVRGYPPTATHHSGTTLTDAARLAGWATPAAREAGGTPGQFLVRKRRAVAAGAQMGISLTSLSLQALLVASGPTSSGSTAGTGSGGQLNPAHSLWLMGFPAEWLWCAPDKRRTGTTGVGHSSASGTR